MSMLTKARDAVVFWNDVTKGILVAPASAPTMTPGIWDHCERVTPKNPRASSHASDALDCFVLAHLLILRHGFSPEAVHRELSKVYEYHWYMEKANHAPRTI